MVNFSVLLEPIAQWFSSFGIPEPIVHWGHPIMMGIVVVAMGSAAGIAGWQGRLAADADIAAKNRDAHRKIAPLMFLFMALGFTGGVLSLVMQGQPIFESGHFWTSVVVLGLLAFNGILAVTGFGGNKLFRTIHAYVGTVALALMVIHGLLGLKLGFAI